MTGEAAPPPAAHIPIMEISSKRAAPPNRQETKREKRFFFSLKALDG